MGLAQFDRASGSLGTEYTQEESEPEITEEPVAEVQEEMVWIPQSGSKYHSKSGCSRMKNPTQVTLSKAESMGFTPCKKCY